MQEEHIKLFSGEIIGTIHTDSNGDQYATVWPSSLIIGWYRVNRNVTTNFAGQVLNNGNTLSALIWNEYYNKKGK